MTGNQELNLTTPWWNETNLAANKHPVSASDTFIAKLFLCGSSKVRENQDNTLLSSFKTWLHLQYVPV